jgi:hypothetical protein
VIIFVLDALDGIGTGVGAVTSAGTNGIAASAAAWGPGIPALAARFGDPAMAWGAVAASVLTAACTIVGAVYLPRNRPAGLRWFRRTALLSILLVQPFHFLDEQFGAVIGLAVNIVLLGGLNALLRSATLEAARTRRAASQPRSQPAG